MLKQGEPTSWELPLFVFSEQSISLPHRGLSLAPTPPRLPRGPEPRSLKDSRLPLGPAQAAKKPPPHCPWGRVRFTKMGLGSGLGVSQGDGPLPRVTVTVADRVQVHIVVGTVRGEGVKDVPAALLMFPAAPVSVSGVT